MTAEVVVEKRAQTLNNTALHNPHLIAVKQTKASFAGCPVSDRKLFNQSSCIIPISILGKKEQEDDCFLATMELVNAYFKSCTLLVVDSLYRHSLRIDHPDKTDSELYAMSIESGDLWLARNQKAYQRLSIPCKIMRWDEYHYHPNFQKQLETVSRLYETDDQYQKAINTTASEYLTRYYNHNPERNLNDKKALRFCIDYLKEGCAGMCLWVEEGYSFEVYPRGRTLATTLTYQKLIQPSYPNLLKLARIRFKKLSLAAS